MGWAVLGGILINRSKKQNLAPLIFKCGPTSNTLSCYLGRQKLNSNRSMWNGKEVFYLHLFKF